MKYAPLKRPEDPYLPDRHNWIVLVDRLRFLDQNLLSPAAHHVAISVGFHADFDGSHVWTSINRLRTVTGRRPDTVKIALADLEDLSLLYRDQEADGQGLAYELTATPELYHLADSLLAKKRDAWAEKQRCRRDLPAARRTETSTIDNDSVALGSDDDLDDEDVSGTSADVSCASGDCLGHLAPMSGVPGTPTLSNPSLSIEEPLLTVIEKDPDERVMVMRHGQRISLSKPSAEKLIAKGEAAAIV